MSGPKLVSVRVLDTGLQAVVATQAAITELARELEAACYRDPRTGEQLRARELVRDLAARVAAAREPFSLGCASEVSREQLERARQRVDDQRAQLRALHEELKAAMRRFGEHRGDRFAAAELAAERDAMAAAFQLHVERVGRYLAGALDGGALRDASRALTAIRWTAPSPQLTDGLRDRVADERARLQRHDHELRSAVRAIRDAADTPPEREAEPEGGARELADVARAQLARVRDAATRDAVQRRLEALEHAGDDGYRMRELHDEILRAIASAAQRQRAASLSAELEAVVVPESLHGAHEALMVSLRSMVARPELRARHVDNAERELDAFRARVREQLRSGFERQLVLAEVSDGLAALGYEAVAADAALDFDKGEAVFRTPDGDFVLLRREAAGQLRYNFAVEGDPRAFNPGERARKLHAMEASCAAFRGVLRTLESHGIRSEMTADPADDKYLVQLPQRYRAAQPSAAQLRRRRQAQRRRGESP